MVEYKFKQGDRVCWLNTSGIEEGTGTVIGVAVAEQPIIGCSYIVKLDNPQALVKHGYDYEAICIFENHLLKIPL